MSRPLSPEILAYGFITVATPRISPDGSKIVYGKSIIDPESKKRTTHLWLSDRDGSAARQLTMTGESNSAPVWSPDGRSIAFVSDRAGGAGLFVLPLDGGDAREVTRHSVGIGGPTWSLDGNTIAYTATVDPANPDETPRREGAPEPVRVTRRLDYKEDSDSRGYIGDVRAQLFLVDVASGVRRRLTDVPFDHTHPQYSPDGKTIAVTLPNRNYVCSQLVLIDVASGARTVVGNELGVVETFAWSPDGSRILISGEPERTYQNDFLLYDVATGATTRLTDDLPVLPEWSWSLYGPPSRPVWLDGSRVLFHAVHKAKKRNLRVRRRVTRGQAAP